MTYQTKWVIDNLGITIDTIRHYEREKLISVKRQQNGNYREFSEEDVERLWTINLLRRMGFSIGDIKKLNKEDVFDVLDDRISFLEQEKKDKERSLNYARTLKLLGQIPWKPLEELGSMTVQEYYDQFTALVCDDDRTKYYLDMADFILKNPQEEYSNLTLGKLASIFEGMNLTSAQMDSMFTIGGLLMNLAKRRQSGVDDFVNQTFIELTIENLLELAKAESPEKQISKLQAARHYRTVISNGDISLMQKQRFGEEGLDFILSCFDWYIDTQKEKEDTDD